MECVYCGNEIVHEPSERSLDPGLCWDCTVARIVLTEEPSLVRTNRKLAKTCLGLLEASASFEGRCVQDDGAWRTKQ